MTPVRVAVHAIDVITREGLMSMLGSRPELAILEREQLAEQDVFVVQVDRMTAQVIAELKAWSEESPVPTVLIAREVHENDVVAVVECGVVAVLYSAQASSDGLVETILSVASGHGALPPDLLGHLIGTVRRLRQDVLSPLGLDCVGFTSREVDVLRLMADGYDTAEIASRLCYSDRTVKTIIWEMTNRLKLCNRPQLVAHAIRMGII